MSIWQSSHDSVIGSVGDHTVTLVPREVERGVTIERNEQPAWQTLAIRDSHSRPLPPFHDAYVREQELIAEYPQPPELDYGLELRWELHRSRYGNLLSLTVAIQTTLLDCHPTIDVHLGSAAEVEHDSGGDVPSGAILSLSEHSGAFLVQGPRDFPFNSLVKTSTGDGVLRMFAEFMEKGVIRKSRLWIAMDAAADLRGLYTYISERPLPLTA